MTASPCSAPPIDRRAFRVPSSIPARKLRRWRSLARQRQSDLGNSSLRQAASPRAVQYAGFRHHAIEGEEDRSDPWLGRALPDDAPPGMAYSLNSCEQCTRKSGGRESRWSSAHGGHCTAESGYGAGMRHLCRAWRWPAAVRQYVCRANFGRTGVCGLLVAGTLSPILPVVAPIKGATRAFGIPAYGLHP
jgi:hypothetical protein